MSNRPVLVKSCHGLKKVMVPLPVWGGITPLGASGVRIILIFG